MFTTECNRSSRTAVDISARLRVGDDGRFFYVNVQETEQIGAIFQIQQQRGVSVDCCTFRLFQMTEFIQLICKLKTLITKIFSSTWRSWCEYWLMVWILTLIVPCSIWGAMGMSTSSMLSAFSCYFEIKCRHFRGIFLVRINVFSVIPTRCIFDRLIKSCGSNLIKPTISVE